MNKKILLASGLAIGLIAFAAATWFVQSPAPVEKVDSVQSEFAETLVRPHSPILGAKDAPVTIVEFFDPACEACRAFHPFVKEILAKYDGDVRVVLRYTAFHGQGSEEAIRVLEAARMQGVFEPVLEAVLQFQPRWASHGSSNSGLIIGIAEQAGLNVEQAKSQMLAPEVIGVLNQDSADVKTVGIRGTPTFFVNGKPLQQFSLEGLKALVASEVAASKS